MKLWDEWRGHGVKLIPWDILEPPMGLDVFGVVWKDIGANVLHLPSSYLAAVYHLVPPGAETSLLLANQPAQQILTLVADIGPYGHLEHLLVVLPLGQQLPD